LSIQLCSKRLCLETSEDMSVLELRVVSGYGESLRVDVEDPEEMVELLEELAELALTFTQYVKESRIGKGV